MLGSVDSAIATSNNSPEANDLILSALGRLPVEGEADYSARIDRHVSGDLGSTNPIMISTSAEFDILGLTGFGLFSFGHDLEPFATSETVETWQTSTDRMLDKVVLRDDLVWSDGEPITAHDIAFTFKVIMDPRVPVLPSAVEPINCVGLKRTMTKHLFSSIKKPLATNVWNINFPVLPKHIYEKTWEADPTLKDSEEHVQLEQAPVCGGPYEIVEENEGSRSSCDVGRAGHQFRVSKFVSNRILEVRFRIIEDPNTTLLALKKGEIHEMILQPEQWTTQTVGGDFYERNTKATAPEWVSFHFGWNIETIFFVIDVSGGNELCL